MLTIFGSVIILRPTVTVTFWILFLLQMADSRAQVLPNSDEMLFKESQVFEISVAKQKIIVGGHLQGIQLHGNNLFISGSSNRVAYLAVFKKEDDNFRFLGIKKLAEAPLNHAGGFQIADNWLAVGIEDPKKKKRSIVQFIDVSNAKTISAPPVYSLERKGEFKLSTAGAVALLKRADHFLLAVGSWDCTTIDLYTSNFLDPYKEYFEFELWTSWDSREAIRKNWTEKSYCNYQNLQLTEDSTGVYITGFCRARNGADQADVYRVNTDSDPYELLQKVASYTVQTKGEVTFRNGAGFCNYNGNPSIISLGRNLSPNTQIQIFLIKAD